MSILGIILILVVVSLLFSRGPGDAYFAPGLSVSGILLVLLLLWAFGAFGGHSHWGWRGW